MQVIIKTEDHDLVFDHPAVSQVNAMGQETYQIIGTPRVVASDTAPEISQEDIDAVVAQTNVSEERAREMLLECEGDIAQAIMKLQEE